MSHGLAWSWPPLLDITSIEDGASYLKVRTKKRSPHLVERPHLVWMPLHVRHWQGASVNEVVMHHFAIAEALDGTHR
ncbi:hypothetical protein [Rhizobium ruizarguesonis]|uniref:hypothetical protein n=1 Tax=Rhizobium ruizarguesonis TaxID=2081791 RepID=UPI001953477C|nr:hypothetical protein [Rhizobium ruizarguesonis]